MFTVHTKHFIVSPFKHSSAQNQFDTNKMPSNMYFKSRKTLFPSCSTYQLCTSLSIITLFSLLVVFIIDSSSPGLYFVSRSANASGTWAGDLRSATFAWNQLDFSDSSPGPLRIAVFSRKWPVGSIPGGMERHAYTLHTTLTQRGHRVHVFTSPYREVQQVKSPVKGPVIHFHEGEVGKWKPERAWERFEYENQQEAFDVIHSESTALPHWLARNIPNLVVTWHGIALEELHSTIYQDLARQPDEPISPGVMDNIQGFVPKVLDEIRFFHHYSHHVAISDSCGGILRDVYQIPNNKVHIILNGVNKTDFKQSFTLGQQFRSKIGLPENATLAIGVGGRLVKDKGHPLLFATFSKFIKTHPNVYLIVAGSGPWESRYRKLGPQVLVLGSLNPYDLRRFYNAIDIFLDPTLRTQGLDLTLMEAMMSGTPVMASRFPSIKGTILVREEFGFLFVPNVDSLLATLEVIEKEGPERLAQRGKACRTYAQSMFTAHKMALAYEKLFLCVKNVSFCKYP